MRIRLTIWTAALAVIVTLSGPAAGAGSGPSADASTDEFSPIGRARVLTDGDGSWQHALSRNARQIAYHSGELAEGGWYSRIFWRDRQTEETKLVYVRSTA